ncbi:MAG: mersacidin/lichenicidin family type 2 lantibiotic [Labilithrix sp.]|nr:mersacidin/lichenicidin family type 2 lantibiotic [Labilithrix sp.]
MAVDIKRALKDKAYLDSLDDEQVKELLANAAGSGELSEAELDDVAGGMRPAGAGSCGTTTGSCLACKRSQTTGACK